MASLAAPAAADDHVSRGSASVVIPVLAADGHPVFCTRNLAGDRARPDGDGGYRVDGLPAGRYAIRLVMAHEHIDVLVTVPADGEVIVPPVIARGACYSVAVVPRTAPAAAPTGWALRYRRSYRAAFGVADTDPSWLPNWRPHRRR